MACATCFGTKEVVGVFGGREQLVACPTCRIMGRLDPKPDDAPLGSVRAEAMRDYFKTNLDIAVLDRFVWNYCGIFKRPEDLTQAEAKQVLDIARARR